MQGMGAFVKDVWQKGGVLSEASCGLEVGDTQNFLGALTGENQMVKDKASSLDSPHASSPTPCILRKTQDCFSKRFQFEDICWDGVPLF